MNEIQKRNFERSHEARLEANRKSGEQIVEQLLTLHGFTILFRDTASITLESSDGRHGIQVGLASDGVLYYSPNSQNPRKGNHLGFNLRFLDSER